MNEQEFLQRLTAVVPSERQLEWQKLGYYSFIHFGMNTMKTVEWGTGKIDAKEFNLKFADTDQWARILKESGSKGVILTAKHHDGFCLFPSRYTDYTIANSPYQNGKGDIVMQMAKSCKKYGLKYGLYLSPWDRHEATYGTPEYNDFFCNQLRELLTNYGDLFELWFDGACGEGKNGKKQIYDFPRYFAMIRKYQPNAVIAICGPDVRWIGNEGGKTRQSEWSVVPQFLSESEYVESISQQTADDNMQGYKAETEDLGSRQALKNIANFIWYPAECDISITRGAWFHNKKAELFGLRSLRSLRKIYYNTVGGNACLLLNVAPDKTGKIPSRYERRLKQLGDSIAKDFSQPVDCQISSQKILADNTYCYDIVANSSRIRLFDIGEDITKGQRVETFELQYLTADSIYKTFYKGTVIGYQKYAKAAPKSATHYRLLITKSRLEPYINKINLYK